jgi:hypothetical protein
MAGRFTGTAILRRAARRDEFKVRLSDRRKILVLNPIRRSLFL